MLNQLTQRMTGLEVMERQSEKVALVGVPVARFMSQGLDNMIERAFYIELEAGRIPEPPTSLSGEEMEIVYTGPLALLQKRLAQGQQITRTLTELAPIFQQFPQAANAIEWNALTKHLLEINDFPVEGIKSQQQLKQEAAQAAAMQQEQQKMQQMETAAKVMPAMQSQGAQGEQMVS